MILAHGPWVWDPRQPFLRRIVLVLDIKGEPEMKEELRSGVINPNNGEEVISTKSFVIAYGRDVMELFAERFLEDAKWFQPETVSPVYAAEWVTRRPKTVEELIGLCLHGKRLDELKQWISDLIFDEFHAMGMESDEADDKHRRLTEELDLYDQILYVVESEHGMPLWRLWDEWVESRQP